MNEFNNEKRRRMHRRDLHGVTMSGAERNVNAGPFNEMPIDVYCIVVKNGGGEGTVVSVSPDTAIDCGATCSAEYEVGETVT